MGDGCVVTNNCMVKFLGVADYQTTWAAMQAFTEQRNADTPDELWALEHPPVYTQGLAGKAEHILNPGNIPVVHIDRGGQVTYHGPGQLLVYLLVDVRRLKLTVRGLVNAIENAVIGLLGESNIEAYAKPDAPGVYVNDAKICALGLKIKRGCSYHGLALNVDMDLSPYCSINPCGFQGLKITQMRDFGVTMDLPAVSERLIIHLQHQLGYPKHE